jgi:hypothetical protein
MRIVIDLPQELDWVADELQQRLEQGQGEMQSGGRPEWGMGYYQCARDLAEGLETRYQSMLATRQQRVVEMKQRG